MLHRSTTRVRLFTRLFSESIRFWQSQLQLARYAIQDMHIQALAWLQNHRTQAGPRCQAQPFAAVLDGIIAWKLWSRCRLYFQVT